MNCGDKTLRQTTQVQGRPYLLTMEQNNDTLEAESRRVDAGTRAPFPATPVVPGHTTTNSVMCGTTKFRHYSSRYLVKYRMFRTFSPK